MKEEFLKMLDGMVNQDFDKNPNLVVISKLHDELFNRGFTDEEASFIVSDIEINVSQNFIDDQDLLNKTVLYYGEMICKMKKSMDKISNTLFWKMIEKRGLTLKYEV